MIRKIGMDRDESWRKVEIFSVTTIPVRISNILVRPSFFNLLVYEKFFKKIELGGRNKNKNKTSKIAESKNKKKIKRLSPIFFFFFFFILIF